MLWGAALHQAHGPALLLETWLGGRYRHPLPRHSLPLAGVRSASSRRRAGDWRLQR